MRCDTALVVVGATHLLSFFDEDEPFEEVNFGGRGVPGREFSNGAMIFLAKLFKVAD